MRAYGDFGQFCFENACLKIRRKVQKCRKKADFGVKIAIKRTFISFFVCVRQSIIEIFTVR